MAQPPARNRVAPTGLIVASAGRGAWMGNRGRLHEGRGTRDVVRNHQVKAWITCALTYRDCRLPQWEPRHYTQLFFLDEAVALAAGHRPCARCRRGAYNAYRDAWALATGEQRPRAYQMDARLHAERIGRGRRHPHPWRELPDGVFVDTGRGPAVLTGDHLTVWDEATNTYHQRLSRPPAGTAQVITPPSTVSVLTVGYPVQIGPPPG
ncbi:hypothetical protein [Actinoplanes sp. L3-i22]|uniref:hypothetical protein n=1 Tax=Actinoplanes sp. L3-i22 TaxID=2836373 RepID=UPI001C76AEC4|nr:hypothetical protein [Actinoplanes sp. L3-i22]BCY09478.1 hypothetical protein L3i22_045660 [Actinoplanes sp. L3-i22]